jgi:hypothetical protein
MTPAPGMNVTATAWALMQNFNIKVKYMLKHYNVIIPALSLFLVLSCWKKQEHDITRPIVPHYIFNGTAVDYDTGENLANIVIKLTATKMLYDVEFESQTDTTDSSGNFSFDPVYPGYYTWSIQKDGYWLAEKRLVIQHRDSTTIIKVPQLFFAQIFKFGGDLAINGAKAWCNIYMMTPSFKWLQQFKTYKQINKVWFDDSFLLSPFYKKNVTSMAFGREVLYACIAPDTLYLVNLQDGSFSGKYQLSQNITSVAYHPPQNCIYTCSKNNIYRHETEQPINIVQSWNYENCTLTSIAYYKGIHTFDNTESLLRKYDSDMNIITTFAIINSLTKNQILNIPGMSFDGYGQLWISIKY